MSCWKLSPAGWDRRRLPNDAGHIAPDRRIFDLDGTLVDSAPYLIGCEPSATVMVGDGEHDIHAGKAAGLLMTIAVTHGYAHVPHEQLGVDRLIGGFDELVPVLEGAGLLRRMS